jgi:uncharacterized protein (DUF433 family)
VLASACIIIAGNQLLLRSRFPACTAQLWDNLEPAVKFTRITVDPKQMGGVPCIRGLRIPVATVVGMVADAMTTTEILAAYPDLEAGDVREALQYAAAAVRERELPLTAPSGSSSTARCRRPLLKGCGRAVTRLRTCASTVCSEHQMM